LKIFIVDLGAIHIQSERELKSLAIQLELSASLIKREPSYRLYAVAPMKITGVEYIERSSLRSGYTLYIAPLEKILDMLGAKRVIVLDPYGDADLRIEDLEWAEAIVIGGIVDRTPIKWLTNMLRNTNIPWAPSRRIRLRGSLLGVPGEINNIVSIVIRSLETRDIERSVREVQPRRDAVIRASAELHRVLARKRITSIEDLIEIYRSLSTWLNLDELGMFRALLKSGRGDLAGLWREKILQKAISIENSS
jgi:tRNA (adenine9-N1/guanine9-N1)-methyltransferase